MPGKTVPFLRAQSPRLIAVLMSLVAAARATAQCPNGRPPPCQAAPGAAARRPAAPALLNSHTWIVVPFSNATKAPDVDWLRDASVNLLSMDMGRWADVSVVSDKRVADLVRELPANRRTESLALSDGLAMAKRAGAGMLVMGDFYKLGTGARIVANVFDVKNGAKLRSFTSEVPTDSLLNAFGPVSRGVLAVPPPVDSKTGDPGTKSLEAYQAFLAGTKALNRYDLSEARELLRRAMAIDSTFALAHLQYSLLLAWGEPPGGAGEARRHALDAQRLGTTLPKRDRLLIDARVASASEDYARSCEISRELVKQDSSDVQALNMLGECSFHDSTIDPSPTDSGTGRFRNSWNTSIRALTRVLELDPSFFGAFEHVFDILNAGQRGGRTCTIPNQLETCTRWYSMVLRNGDSLLTVPNRDGPGDRGFFAQQDRALKERPRVANLDQAKTLAKRWLDADRNSEGARLEMARVYMAQGDLAAADVELHRLSQRATQENFAAVRLTMEVDAKRGHGEEARAMFDSLVKAIPDNPSIDGQRGSMELMFGRFTRFNRAAAVVGRRISPEAEAYEREIALAMVGAARPQLARAESAFAASMRGTSCDIPCRFGRLTASLAYSLHVPLGAWPDLDSARKNDLRLSAAWALLKHDTVELRRVARANETNARNNISTYQPEYGWSIVAADAYLALHDSVSARRVVRFFVDTAMNFMPIGTSTSNAPIVIGGTPLWPRAMLLRADLAKAAGDKAEARLWYLRVLDLWANADPELQPTIERIRAALAALDTRA